MSAHTTVLIVDDEPRVLEGMEAILRGKGFRTRQAPSAAAAMEILRCEPVDVVISDEHMPGTPGSRLLACIWQEYPDTVRILLSGRTTVEAAIRAVNQGRVTALLEKPCDAERLVATIVAGLRQRAKDRTATQVLQAARDEAATLAALASAGGGVSNGELQALDSGILDGFSKEDLRLLTEREREILTLLVRGRRLSQVASALHISAHTVRTHLKAIFRKLDVHSQAELLERSRRMT